MAKNQPNWVLIGGIAGGVIALALVALLIVSNLGTGSSQNMADLIAERTQQAELGAATATQEASNILSIADRIPGVVANNKPLVRDHKDELHIPFGDLPPDGGVHNSVWQNCRAYDKPVRTENAVHSLEHGAVWITYQPDLPSNQVAILDRFAGPSQYVLVSPFPGLRSPVVLTAWGYQLEVDSADDARVKSFIQTFAQGPQTPEPGASCTGGKGVADG